MKTKVHIDVVEIPVEKKLTIDEVPSGSFFYLDKESQDPWLKLSDRIVSIPSGFWVASWRKDRCATVYKEANITFVE